MPVWFENEKSFV